MSFRTLSVVALIAATSAAPAFSSESHAIVGVNMSTSISGQAEAEFENFGMTVEEDLSSDSFSIFIGYQTERNNRFKFSFESRGITLEDSDYDEDATALRFDWDFVYGEQKVHPFWSIGFGLYNLEDPGILVGSNLEGDNLSGFSFQLGAGVKIDLTDEVEASIAFERQAIGWQQIEVREYDETVSMTYVHNSLSAGLLVRF